MAKKPKKGDTNVSDFETPEEHYDASDIKVLEGLEAVRVRPGMYIGSTGERGLHHLVYEVVDNSVDESLAGYCDHIEVTLQADGGVRVADNGRGIPVAEHPSEHRPTVEVVMTILHAGGKFGGSSYAVSGGLHGVGISVVNALSTRILTTVKRDGFQWHIEFGDGGKVIQPLRRGEPTDETGTVQVFYPDPDIFETVEFDYETLRTRFQQMAFLNKGLRITLTDERPNVTAEGDFVTGDQDGEADSPKVGHRSVSYCYENGLHDYVHFINTTKKSEVIHEEIIDFEASVEDTDNAMALEIALQWTSAYSESIYTYANTINTTEGGTHEEGFRAALTSLMNKIGREKGFIKDKDENLSGDDCREGLTAVISVKIRNPQFEGQTKTKLGNTEARTFVQQTVYSQLGDWFDAHPAECKAIISKAQSAQQARNAARKARDATRRKTALDSFSMPGKLRDCSSRDASECEIFLVEGDSAGGSAVAGRDPAHQAILPLRGKILNVEKARLDRALDNKEIQSLITAFGTGIGEDFDLSKLRYYKIVLMADADVDGQHITTLLLTLLFRYMRPLIENGHVFLATPPLYRLKWSNKPHQFVYSDKEKDKLVSLGLDSGARMPKEGGIQRYKGLGEMSAQELWETTMDPSVRLLKQVTMDEAASADEVFSLLMGEDVSSRRAFIQRNAQDVRFLDI